VQRWLGRAGTVVAAAMGHVGATLAVAVVLAAGISAGRLDPAVARQPDVGVSYGLLAVTGLLSARLPGRRRTAWAGGLGASFGGLLLVRGEFADLGHVVALGIGFGLALLTARAASGSPPPAQRRRRAAASASRE
jgi:hypothetical protein